MNTPGAPFGPGAAEESPDSAAPAPLPYPPPWTATLPVELRGNMTMNRGLRQHWTARHFATQEIRAFAWAMANEEGRRAPRYKVPVSIEFRPFFTTNPLPDSDAIGIIAKAALDGFVDAGVIPDDSPEWVTSVTYHRAELLTTRSVLWVRFLPEGGP